MHAAEISRTGMDVEWRRLEVIAENIANVGTTRTASGGPYQAMRLVSGPRTDFATLIGGAGGDDLRGGDLRGVMAYGLEPTTAGPRRVHDPSHPHADADGFVTYPGVDQAGEFALLLKTARAYEANLVTLNAARQMYSRALDLGKRG
jgi:flagellar basal-body rod protein FlgC